MRKLVSGADISEDLMAVLQAWGLPKHVISLDLHIDNGPVTITCTFHPERPNGDLTIHENALLVATKRFNLTPVED